MEFVKTSFKNSQTDVDFDNYLFLFMSASAGKNLIGGNVCSRKF